MPIWLSNIHVKTFGRENYFLSWQYTCSSRIYIYASVAYEITNNKYNCNLHSTLPTIYVAFGHISPCISQLLRWSCIRILWSEFRLYLSTPHPLPGLQTVDSFKQNGSPFMSQSHRLLRKCSSFVSLTFYFWDTNLLWKVHQFVNAPRPSCVQ